jgi:hypothetical protein
MGRREIVIPYAPRQAFRDYHDTQKRYCLTVAHRRAGKTVARVNKLIRKAVECTLPNPRFGYLAPFFVQAKDIAWMYLLHYAGPILELGGKINASELSVTLPHNNAVVRLYGAENAERMRGVYFDGIVIDEAQDIAAYVLTQIILPALADRKGWLDVSGTPKGWTNLLGALAKLAKENDEWFFQVLRASETGILDHEELARLKRLMPENEFEAEMECSFDAAITGAFYGKEFVQAEREGRIRDVDYDPSIPVYTAWDLGYSDDTSIWFYQVFRGEVRIIDYYANSGFNVEHYASVVLNKRYKYKTHWLPHDARAKTLASGGRSIVEQLASHLGIGNLSIFPELSVQDGIQAVRLMLPRCYFDKAKTEPGIEALKQYQREYDDDKKAFRDKPRHDWTSHAADAFRGVALAWREEFKEEAQNLPIRGITVGNVHGVSLNEMWDTVKKQSSRI